MSTAHKGFKPVDGGERKSCCFRFNAAFLELHREKERDLKLRGSSVATKLLVIISILLKVALMIAFSVISGGISQQFIVLSTVAMVLLLSGFAACHFKLRLLAALYVAVQFIMFCAESGFLIYELIVHASKYPGNVQYALIVYIATNVVMLSAIISGIVFLVKLTKITKAEEAKEEKEKEEARVKAEAAKRQMRREARQAKRRVLKAERAVAKAAAANMA